MSEYRERAMELFRQGYNCCQAVFAAFCDELDIDVETALKISSSFGGGMGGLREVCGSVSGMFMVAGTKYGYTDPKDRLSKAEHYKLIKSMADKFKANNTSIVCKELLGLEEKSENCIKANKNFKKRPCVELVGDAAQIMQEFIKKQN